MNKIEYRPDWTDNETFLYNVVGTILVSIVTDVNRKHISEELAATLGYAASFIQDMVGAEGSDRMPYVTNDKEELDEYDAKPERSSH